MIKYLIPISTLILLQSCSPLIKWQTDFPDNMAEEYIEDIIEGRTGYEVDLSPITGKEKQKFEINKKN